MRCTRLTQRFVDRRTSVLMRRLKQKESLLAEVNDKGEVTVEGEFAGRLEGFRFPPIPPSNRGRGADAARAAYEALRPEFHLRADRFYNAPDTELDFTEQGGLMWGSRHRQAGQGRRADEARRRGLRRRRGRPDIAEKVRRRLQHFIDRKVRRPSSRCWR
jgi:ATP-dependent RNA helicase SUPV3L1/SUV3